MTTEQIVELIAWLPFLAIIAYAIGWTFGGVR